MSRLQIARENVEKIHGMDPRLSVEAILRMEANLQAIRGFRTRFGRIWRKSRRFGNGSVRPNRSRRNSEGGLREGV